MRPEWFSVDDVEGAGGIPYSQMWADDRFGLLLFPVCFGR